MAYVIKLRERDGFVLTAVNTLTFTVTHGWSEAPLYVIVKIYAPSGALIYHGRDHADGDELELALPVQDGAAVQGTYRITYQTQSDDVLEDVLFSFNVKTAAVEAYGDGFVSSFYATDVSPWGDYAVSSKQWRIEPPAGSPLLDFTGTPAPLVYGPNIWGGLYRVRMAASYQDVTGTVDVYDATLYDSMIAVYDLNEQQVLGWVQSYLDDYTENLSSNPRQAAVQQPVATRVALLLYFYYKHVRYEEYEDAYFVLDELRSMMSPEDSPSVEEVVPFSDTTGSDHTHSNKLVIDGFTESEGDLLWNGTVVGSSVPSYTVKATSTDATPGFLDAKVDGTTISVEAGKLTVLDAYLQSRIDGVTIRWNGSEIYTVDRPSSGTLRWQSDVVYDAGDVVSYAGKLYSSDSDANEGNLPTVGGWTLLPASALAHIQNTDYRFANKQVSANLSSVESGSLTIPWTDNNVLVLTQDDATSEMESLLPVTDKVIGASDLENHDVTIHVVASTGFTIKHSDTAAATVTFNNKGEDLYFDTGTGWARYRYNVTSGQMDLVATSIPYLDVRLTSIVSHLQGDDTEYDRFVTSFQEHGGEAKRVAINLSGDLDTLMEAGYYYGLWTNYPPDLDGVEGSATDGWVQVVPVVSGANLYTLQRWMATGTDVNTGVETYAPYSFARVHNSVSWGAWVSADVTLSHADLTSYLGAGPWHLSEAEKLAATRMASVVQSGLLSAAGYSEFKSKQDAITAGTHLEFTGDTLAVTLTAGRLLSKNIDQLNVDATVLPTDDVATDDAHNWSAQKIISYIAGSGESGSYSKSYTVSVPAGADLATKIGFGITGPAGWTFAAVGGSSTDLEITHGVGETPASVEVYAVNAGVKSRLGGNNAYSSVESNTSDTKVVLYAYAATSSETEIRIVV